MFGMMIDIGLKFYSVKTPDLAHDLEVKDTDILFSF